MEWIESVWSDFRYALRTLRRMPAFTTVATITLALGIGATTAMFTLVNSILLRPLPYPNADRLVRLIQSYPEKGLDTWGISQQNIALYRDRATDFEAFAAYRGGSVTDSQRPRAGAHLDPARRHQISSKSIGVSPAIGRAFTADEDKPGKNNVVVLSYGPGRRASAAVRRSSARRSRSTANRCRSSASCRAASRFRVPTVNAWLPMGLDPNRSFGFTQ